MNEMTKQERDQQRAEIRRILLFLRAANGLRELTTKYPLTVSLEWEEARVQPPDRRRQRVMAAVSAKQTVEPIVLDMLATRLRPFMLPKEDCYFAYIVTTLPKHVRIDNGPMTFEELRAKWESILTSTTAPIPVGTTVTNWYPGVNAEATSEGRITLMADNKVMTGREVIDLLLYGKLVRIIHEV